MNPADAQAAFAATVVDEWVRGGVTDAVVAPGSRSTPILDALAADGRLRLHVVLDERAAGFLALGLGLASGRPAPVVTTSGTAAVELHAAVAEAHHAGVPLLVVTADRPPELHDVDAPQTLDQRGLYAAAVRFAADPGIADVAAGSGWRSFAARALVETVAGRGGPGPVHLNLPFREPLLPAGRAAAAAAVPEGRPDGQPWHVAAPTGRSAAPDAVLDLLADAGGDGVVVVGHGAGDPEAVAQLAAASGWPVLADPRSGCRVPGPSTVGAFDALVRTPPFAQHPPGAVLRLGRLPASKVLGQWLARATGPAVVIDPHGVWSDPDRRATAVVAADPAATCLRLAERFARRPPRAGALPWSAAEAAAQRVYDEALAGPALSEPAVTRAVLAAAPPGSTVVAASSMPVRDIEWYGAPRAGLRVVANRGVNGIDGTLATALGVAAAGNPVVAVVGDLAFLYDAGALLWAGNRRVDLTIVVIDNNGGGIFSFLPQATALPTERFEQLWATPHGIDLAAVAGAYGVAAAVAGDLDELRAAVAHPSGVRVVVVPSERAANVEVHDRLNRAVAAAVAELS